MVTSKLWRSCSSRGLISRLKQMVVMTHSTKQVSLESDITC